MPPIKRITFIAALIALTYLPSEAVLAACNATVNGRPMTYQECALGIRAYGQVLPGDYLVDANGNWVNTRNLRHRGNTLKGAPNSRSGSWGGGSVVSPRGVYDSSGGCEGGSCVNIID